MKRLSSVRNVLNLGLVSLACVCALSLSCSAAEFGIGIAANDNDQGIYVPIDFADRFRAELSAAYVSREDKDEMTEAELCMTEAGIGLFLLTEIHERTQLYYGCRFLYIDFDQEQRMRDDGDRYQKMSGKGYGIAPTLGVEYFLGRHISLGGEVEYYYEKMDTDHTYSYADITDRDGEQTDSGLDSRVVLRFYF